MKVKDLITLLQQSDAEAEVDVADAKIVGDFTNRQKAVAAYRAQVMAYLNDVLNVADVDPVSPLVAPEKYFAGGAQAAETLELIR